MTKLALAMALMLAFTGSSFGQNAPNAGKKSIAQAKPIQSVSGCKLVGTVRGTKLWAGDCTAPDQLRSSVPATDSSEPPLQDQAAGAIPAGEK